uniref:Ig-like domain-containing protein n=1 Tax=Seriola dumerili TaxID=41447 RepID=A0A3B4TFZ0_SERDU
VCSSLEDSTLICSCVITRHILQFYGHVTVLHLSVVQVHPVLKRWMLVFRNRTPVPEHEDIFCLQFRSGPLYNYDVCAAGSSAWQSDMTCTNNYTLVSDSGEYWCEAAGGERSNTVTITVTGTLISPVLPVMEGESVSLRCRTRKNVSDLTANFYKDGLLIGNSSTGNITIESVSRSDDGLYKCNISGAGESPQSRLMVTVLLDLQHLRFTSEMISVTFELELGFFSLKKTEAVMFGRKNSE